MTKTPVGLIWYLIFSSKRCAYFGYWLLDTRNEYMDHILFDFGKHLRFGIKGVMLSGKSQYYQYVQAYYHRYTQELLGSWHRE